MLAFKSRDSLNRKTYIRWVYETFRCVLEKFHRSI